MNIELQQYVHCRPAESWDTRSNIVNGFSLTILGIEDMKSSGYTLVTPITVNVELPDNWNPSALIIETLREKEQKLRAEFGARITAIQKQISELSAITCEVA